MNRSPLYYPMNRGGDADAGGAADLQTDVMRFMAILSLCLVAIFALVQSIPLAPSSPTPEKPVADTQPPTSVEEPPNNIAQRADIELVRPTPIRMVARRESVTLQRPSPAPVRSAETERKQLPTATTVAEATPAEDGFTLRFETDRALTGLVARQQVGFYAISPEKILRMSITGNDISFRPATLPHQYHEMDRSTVPAEVLAAFRSSDLTDDIKWGVTLPPGMSQQLNAFLSDENGGALVIAASGRINMDR